MNRLLAAASIAWACLLGTNVFGATEIVRLTIEEENGVERVNEPMTMGVPLPEGRVSDAARLGLVDAAGRPIPCQVTEVARWLDGKSVKWVHVTWNQSVKAKGRAAVAVVLNDSAVPTGQGGLSATAANNVVTVQNRFIKFVVKGANFSGFDAAWFDPAGAGEFGAANQVVKPGGASVAMAAPKETVTVADEKFVVPADQIANFSSANDPDGTVEIEEQGPRRVVVRASGRHMCEGEMLNYIVRFYAYADSPIVRVSHTFVGAHGTGPAAVEFLSGLYLDVPTTLAGGKVTVGGEDGPVVADGAAAIVQDTSDHYAITSGGRTLAEGKGKSIKGIKAGWIDISKGGVGLAAGIKWFWQMRPKGLSADSAGLLRVGLYPSQAAQPLEVYMGQSRTHYMTFVFHDGKTTAADLNNIFAGQHRPLRAWAEPKYYCRDTHCFGWVAEADPKLFGADADKAARHDDTLKKSLAMLLAKVDSRKKGKYDVESYGVYAWGDLMHHEWGDWNKAPYQTWNWKISWEGNYYDHPYAMLMQFIRTGDKQFLERYWPNAVQIGDVHTVNYHPKPELIGACRYCPPRNFMAGDPGVGPYVSVEYNHYKTQSVFAHWYLTGDRRSYEHCRMLADHAYANHAADSGWADRGVGAQMAGLWNAYELWGEAKYLERLAGMAGRAMRQYANRGKYQKGYFVGIANEGLCYYYWVSGDPKVVETLDSGMKVRKPTAGHMAFSYAMMYRLTGNEEYRDCAWKCILGAKPTFSVHDGGQAFRGIHHALFFLSEASKGWKPASSTSKGSGAE